MLTDNTGNTYSITSWDKIAIKDKNDIPHIQQHNVELC